MVRVPEGPFAKVGAVAGILALFAAVFGITFHFSQESPTPKGSPTSTTGHPSQSRSSSPSVGSNQSDPTGALNRQWVGEWNGNLVQPGYGSYDVQLHITSVTRQFVGTVSYPALGCRGDLDLLVAADRLILRLTEYIVQGNNCANGGQITLTIVGDNVAEYSWASASTTATASGTVSKA